MVTLTCTVLQGNPMSYSYRWMHNGTTINSISTGSTTSTLTLNSIRAEDFGDYLCSVSNGIQPDGADNLTLSLPSTQKIYFSIVWISEVYIILCL